MHYAAAGLTRGGHGASSAAGPIAAATGIRGDDALLAYSSGAIDGEVRVARVRPREARSVASFRRRSHS